MTIADDAAANGRPPGTAPSPSRARFDCAIADEPKSLARRAINGSVWTIFGYGGAQILRFLTNLVLTRLLFPEAFGLMRLVNVFMQGLQMFSDIGIAPAIIQHRRAGNPSFYNTAWTMQVIRGLSLFVVGCLIAYPLAHFYGDNRLLGLTMAASLTAFLAGFNSTKLVSESRELRLARVVCLDIIAQLAAVAVMVPLAWLWKSVWPLVVGAIVATVTKTILSQMALPGPRNRFRWDRESARELYRFGRWIFVSTVFTFLGMQTDSLLLGKLIDLNMLGVYSIALGVVSIVIGVFEQLTNRILMPAMAHWSRTSETEFRDGVLKSRKIILSAASIAVADLILLAPALFETLYDPRYHAAGRITQLLGFGLWFTLLQRTGQASLLAAGDSRTLAAANIANCVVTVIAAPLGFYWWGLYGFICGWTLGNFAGAAVVDWATARRGVPVVRQDFFLTCGMLAYVVVGFALRHGLRDYSGLNVPQMIVDFLPATVLTLIAGGLMVMSYPQIRSFGSGMFGSLEETPEDEEATEVVEAILGTTENVISGGPQD